MGGGSRRGHSWGVPGHGREDPPPPSTDPGMLTCPPPAPAVRPGQFSPPCCHGAPDVQHRAGAPDAWFSVSRPRPPSSPSSRRVSPRLPAASWDRLTWVWGGCMCVCVCDTWVLRVGLSQAPGFCIYGCAKGSVCVYNSQVLRVFVCVFACVLHAVLCVCVCPGCSFPSLMCVFVCQMPELCMRARVWDTTAKGCL